MFKWTAESIKHAVAAAYQRGVRGWPQRSVTAALDAAARTQNLDELYREAFEAGVVSTFEQRAKDLEDQQKRHEAEMDDLRNQYSELMARYEMKKARAEAAEREVERLTRERDLDLMFLRLFNNIDAKTAEDHVDAFMDQNYAEAIHIDKRTNWKIVRDALIGAFKVAETRGYTCGRTDTIRALAKEPPK